MFICIRHKKIKWHQDNSKHWNVEQYGTPGINVSNACEGIQWGVAYADCKDIKKRMIFEDQCGAMTWAASRMEVVIGLVEFI